MKTKIQKSFDRVKVDVYQLYDHVNDLYAQVEKLKAALGKTNGTLVASKKGEKVHIEVCPFAKNIKQENKVEFEEKNFALEEGYKACACVA